LIFERFFSVVNWGDLFTTLGSTAILVAVLGYVAKTIIGHFFNRDLEKHKTSLKQAADLELADAKARTEQELVEARAQIDRALVKVKERSDAELLAQKLEFDRQMVTFQTELATRIARADRIRQEIVRWANPILGSVMDLTRRLRNILREQGYLALSPDTESKVDSEWSIHYEYFLPSTVYLFCQYFCWVRLLEESLSFELFEKHEVKDNFFESIHAVGRKLSAYPMEELRNLTRGRDCQVFNLQQRALGETVTMREGSDLRCMRYSEFLVKWSDASFTHVLDPMTRFVDRLQPTDERRWKRLELMAEALEHLHQQCKRLLAPDAGDT
jgi:F0F1-type ATP synthase membrane subunit b/b'